MQQSQEEDQIWQQNLNQDALVGGDGDDDFTKFLELGNDFVQFEADEQQHNAPSGLDTPMGRLTFAQNGQQPLTPQQQTILQSMNMAMGNIHSPMTFPQMQQQDHSQQYQQFSIYQQMHNPYHHQIPPTPVSAEMQAAKYAQAMDMAGQIIFDRQNASFTPLVSPAQTPGENAWTMPDYVVAEEFFSPLTSPAIEAQQNYSTNTTSSPVDLSSDQPTGVRKSRRKLNPTTRVASAKNVRSSGPSKVATRRRQNSLDAPTKDPSTNVKLYPNQLLPSSAMPSTMSSEDSVSPEPQSESLMRPPPVPLSRTPTALRPQSRSANAPATPATLMKIPGKQAEMVSSDGHMIGASEILEDITLPAAAADLPSRVLPELDTVLGLDDGDSTPTMSAKTPKLSADSTPRSTGAKTANNSQESLIKGSRGGRTSKKRQSISQVPVSPALRPRISPSISPLVPSTGTGLPIMSAETSALYLASKSNYQNIIDGTHLPGVSYPETLAENLSSKRTSHKIAEQGRRNRINVALKEIESLLPPTIAAIGRKDKEAAKDAGEDSGDKPAAAAGASKASTVEMAIVYIKSLQKELQETRDKLEVAEKSLAEGSGSGSTTSEQVNE